MPRQFHSHGMQGMRCIFMSGKSKIQLFNSNIEKVENKGRKQIYF